MTAGWLLMLLALADGVAFALSGFGTRWGWWDYRLGLGILRFSALGAIAIATLAVLVLVVPRLRRAGAASALAALVVSLAVLALPLQWLHEASSVPAINDITTDTADPPAFVAILPKRAGASVPSAHPGAAVAQAQREAYPDIVTATLRVPPSEALSRASVIARNEGWDVVAVDAAAGRLEATATTWWFGFKDDVVIRVRPAPGGSRVDVRSVSRVGKSDLGTNARRIRHFLAQLGS